MINAYKNFFKNYAEFTGRSTRPDYWWVWLGNFILSIPFWIIYFYTVFLSTVMDSVSDSASEATFMFFGLVAIIYAVFYLAILVPTIALSVRRLRDAGFQKLKAKKLPPLNNWMSTGNVILHIKIRQKAPKPNF